MNTAFDGLSQVFHDNKAIGTAIAPAPDRRARQRLRTVYRVARIAARGDEGLARVHNISDGGLMLSMSLDLCLGDTVRVDLSDTCPLTGTVVWRDNGRCGIKLNQNINSAAVLKRLFEERRAGDLRPLRIVHDKALIVTCPSGLQVVRLRDISQAGMKVAHDGGFTPGLPVKIKLSAEVERRGVVRWSRDFLAGIALTEMLSVEELGSMRAI